MNIYVNVDAIALCHCTSISILLNSFGKQKKKIHLKQKALASDKVHSNVWLYEKFHFPHYYQLMDKVKKELMNSSFFQSIDCLKSLDFTHFYSSYSMA